jgi:hypothetical protein
VIPRESVIPHHSIHPMKYLSFIALLSLFSLAASAQNRPEIKQDPDALYLTTTTDQKVAFHGSTPVDQRSGANQTALTDSTGGDVTGATLAATAGISTLSFHLNLAAMTTSAADLVTTFTPGYKFKILSVAFVTTTLGEGASASQVINLEIGTTNVTGGVLTLLLADTDTLGKQTAATAITAANTGAADATISVEVAASGTVFTAGQGTLLIRIQNMDVQDNAAKTAELVNELRASLVEKGLIAGS